MNAKQITIKNIENNCYRTGDSVKGKGIEIFDNERTFISMWSVDTYPKKREKLLEKLLNQDLTELYVSKIRYVSKGDGSKQSFQYSNRALGQKSVSIKQLIEAKFEGIEYIYITRDPRDLLGYFPISQYKSDLESQKEMIISLLKLVGKTVFNDELEEDESEFDYKDDVMQFPHYSEYSNDYYNGDYSLTHGTQTYFPDKNECEEMNGKLTYHNSMADEDFWNIDYKESLQSYLTELDPEEKMCVYHRKGKDWYIGCQYKTEHIPLIYFDAEHTTIGEVEEIDCHSLVYEDDTKLTEKFVEVLESHRDGMALNSYINNELEVGEENGFDYYNNSNVDQELVYYLYEDKNDLKEEILNTIENWELETIPSEFLKAYNKIIDSKTKVDKDLKVELTVTVMQSAYNSSVPTMKRYNHLKILKAMEKRFEYKLVKTSISDSIDTIAWALKKEDEEYHFNIASIIVRDIEEVESFREFLINALEALEKRKLERLSQAELFEKASYVFVGIEDSLQSGNCSFGTTQFITKHRINTKDIGGIRGDVLLQMENSNFTKRAVSHAIAFNGGVAC